MSEPGLGLVIADLMIAATARQTGSAPADERCRHAFPTSPFPHLTSHRHDGAREFVSGHVWHRDNVGIMPLPTVPITTAQSGRLHGDDHPMWKWGGIRDRFECQGAAKAVEGDGSHG